MSGEESRDANEVELREGKRRTSFPVETHPSTFLNTPLFNIFTNTNLVLGSNTCSWVARSALSFWLAFSLAAFLFTDGPGA